MICKVHEITIFLVFFCDEGWTYLNLCLNLNNFKFVFCLRSVRYADPQYQVGFLFKARIQPGVT